MADPRLFCQVALARPVLETFTYGIPGEIRATAEPGVRVLVPFGQRKVVGCIVSTQDRSPREDVKFVLEALDVRPILSSSILRLCRWIAEYYAAPPGMVLRAALPPGTLKESTYRVRLVDDPAPAHSEDLPSGAQPVLDRLARAHSPLQPSTLRDEAGLGTIWPVLRTLEQRDLIRIEEELPGRDPGLRRQVIRLRTHLPTLNARRDAFGRANRQRQAYETLEELGGVSTVAQMESQLGFSRSVLRGLVQRGLAAVAEERIDRDPFSGSTPSNARHLDPTPAQRRVLDALRVAVSATDPGVALLRGVTGSGKTLVYIRLIQELAEGGRGAIVLVPEISLTPQTVERFRAEFGSSVAVLHSGLSPGERTDEWRALREGRKRIAIGARSAVFAPVDDLGVIVLDEEHDGSYKQSETPRYHARAVAAVRCRLEGALCLLGSATPSLESWHNAAEGRYELLELPDRVTDHPLPEVRLIDLRAEPAAEATPGPTDERAARGSELTGELRDAIAQRLERREQSILLLNRRGYATFVQCDHCGKVWHCAHCNVSLTFHRRRRQVLCHHCGFSAPPPVDCDECGSRITYSGIGTERVEQSLGEAFPAARIARMDMDTTSTKWSHHEILERVRKREIDVLLGTQMIAKGLDFPGVTLVGVINADVGLNLPDFRASERTFQLIAQVAGRAGRGAEPGEVLVQTARPGHFALQAAISHDYEGFARRESDDRREPSYPPHSKLANIVVSGVSETAVADTSLELADDVRGLIESRVLPGIEVVGPAPCPIDRLRDRWRWHFLLRSEEAGTLGSVLRYIAVRHGQPTSKIRVEIDRDPEALL